MGLLVLCTFDAFMRSHLAKQLVANKGVSAHRLIFGFVGSGPIVDASTTFAARSWDVSVPGKRKESLDLGAHSFGAQRSADAHSEHSIGNTWISVFLHHQRLRQGAYRRLTVWFRLKVFGSAVGPCCIPPIGRIVI